MNDRRNEIKKIAQDCQPELYSEAIEDDLDMEFEGVHIVCSTCDKWLGFFERIKIDLRVWNFNIDGIKCAFCDHNEMYIDFVDYE